MAFEYHGQKYLFDGRVIPEANDFLDVDYSVVARALGAWGTRRVRRMSSRRRSKLR